MFTIKFQSEEIEITNCDDPDRKTLMHIFISLLCVYESRWSPKSISGIMKNHKICDS